ncbi:MAG: sulfotransferase [Gammaproteobacteria bacterium]|nr:sulfotransferase [Gammaproteobacteria bacterium]MDH3413509.1 sulfotransferase [Gammaproteobacteria bacterium]
MRLADFICAGAQKSGTTWLYAQLCRHPQVFMRTKELNFFYRELPLSWYAEQFSGAANGQRCGDISPNYAAFAGLAENIFRACPTALIIHLLRDPVERAFSQWKMARHLGNIPPEIPFIQAFRDNLQYMRRRGEYSAILEEYVRFYPLGERLAVFWYNDIRIRPAGLLREIMTFLDVDWEWKSADLHAIVAPSPAQSVISSRDAVEVAAYYAPFDRRLCSLLGVATLPWSTNPPDFSVNW